MENLFMVFDVESIGLHGEGFAVGWVVVRNGQIIQSNRAACAPDIAEGGADSRDWIKANVPALPVTHPNTESLRSYFWGVWTHWKEQGALLVADCAWPVEARFLAACVEDEPDEREWQGPYPLHDVASVMLMAGRDPLATYERLSEELPAHDPMADARQSARLWLECLNWAVTTG